jgi:hypothetical protein
MPGAPVIDFAGISRFVATPAAPAADHEPRNISDWEVWSGRNEHSGLFDRRLGGVPPERGLYEARA